MANKQRCSTSLIIRKTQIIKIIRYYFTTIRMAIIKKQTITSVDKDMNKSKLPSTGGGNVKWYRHCENQCSTFLTS